MKKTMSFILIMVLVLESIGFAGAGVQKKQEEPNLTLDSALKLVLVKDAELALLRKQWLVKGAELEALKVPPPTQQLGEFIAPVLDQAYLSLKLRAQAIKSEQTTLERQYRNRALKLLFDTKQQYLDVLIQEASKDYEAERIQRLESAYVSMYAQYLNGKLVVKPLETNQNELKTAKANFDTTSAAAITFRSTLGLQLGGMALDKLTLEIPAVLPPVALDDAFYESLLSGAAEQDTSALTASESVKSAKRDLGELLELYRVQYPDKFISFVKALNNQPQDYEAIFKAYLNMSNTSGAGLLVAAAEPVNYPVVQGFFKHQIPLEWFRTKPDALTYWNQLPSPPISALAAYDMRVNEARLAKDNLTKTLQEPYSNLGLTLSKQLETNKNLEITTSLAEKLKKGNLLGLTRYEEVLAVNERIKKLELELVQNKLEAYQLLAQLEYYSSGALGRLVADKVITDMERIKVSLGLPAPSSESLGAAYWHVKTVDNGFGFNFKVTVPEKLKLTHYQLLDPNGVALSEPMPISQSLNHEPIEYSKDASLTLLIYQKGQLKYRFKISADALYGILKL